MTQRFRDVLDAKLSDLLAGKEPDLTPYAAGTPNGDDLADLLAVAARLQAVPVPQPSAAAVARGRQRLMQALEAEGQRRSDGFPGSWRWVRPVFAGAMAALMCVVLVFVLNSVATRSLPGSALYAFKTVKEHVQVWLANSPREQADVHLLMARRRLNELQAMTLRDGAPDLALLDAMAQEMDAALAAMEEVPITQIGPLLSDLAAVARRQQSTLLWTQRNSPPATQPALAQAILRAHEIYIIAMDAQSQGLATVRRPASDLAVAAIVEFKGPVLGEDPEVLTIGSHQVALNSLSLLDGQPSLGSTVEVRAARLEDGRLVALNVRQTAPPAEGVWVHLNGAITGAYDSTWLINDRPVVFNADTNLVGWLLTGATVDISGVLRSDGSVLAHNVEVETSQPEVVLTGPVEARAADQWVVANVAVRVDASTYLDESQALAVESQGASVRAVRLGDGTLVARSITPLQEAPPAALVLRDIVSARDGNVWTVGGWTAVADAETEIAASKDPVGRVAEVSGQQLPDGTLRASRIVVEPTEPADSVRITFEGPALWTEGVFQVAGHSVDMSQTAEIWCADRRLAQLTPAPGRWLRVDGWLLPDGCVQAEAVRILRPAEAATVHGTIAGLLPDRLTLDGLNVYLDESVEVVAPGGAMALSDLKEGLLVAITGEMTENGMLAWTIQVGGDLPPKEPVPQPTNQPVPGNDKPTPVPTPTGGAKPKQGPGGPVPVPVTPTPTPTPMPTQGPEPSPTPEPTATPTPFPTVVVNPKDRGGKPSPMPPLPTPTPTPTVEPSQTPEPTDTPPPGPGGPGGPPVPPPPGPGGPGEPPLPSVTPEPTATPRLPRYRPTRQPPGKPMPGLF